MQGQPRIEILLEEVIKKKASDLHLQVGLPPMLRVDGTLRPGDRVVGECVVNNGNDHFGFSISGADAEYFVAQASWLHRIPDELSFMQGAFVEPLSVAYSAAVAAGGIDASDEVAVIGGGPIGLLCVMTAAAMGGSVTLIEPQVQRRALALEVGAKATIDPSAGALSEQVGEATDGRGFDVVIDYLWGPPTEALLAAIARKDFKPAKSRVRLVEVGESAGTTISLPAAVLRSSWLEILGAGSGSAAASPEIWSEAVRQLMSNVACGALRIDTERVPLDEVENAWQREQQGRRAVIIP